MPCFDFMDEKAERCECVVDFRCADCTSMNFFNAGNCRRLKVAEEGELEVKSAFVLDKDDNLVWCCWSNEWGIDVRRGGSGGLGKESSFIGGIGKSPVLAVSASITVNIF